MSGSARKCAGAGRPACMPSMTMNAPSQRPGADPAAVLDEQALARLRELDPDGRHGVFVRVLSTYESSLAKLAAQLAQARDRSDLAGAGAVAHTLKSSSASVGALALSTRCAALERDARAGAEVDLRARVDELLAECEVVAAAVRAMLGA